MSVQEDMAIDITRQLIDSLFGSDSDEKPIKKANKFSDGLSLIRAFSSLQKGENLKSPLKTVNTNSMDKKWQIWYWKPTNGQTRNWEDFLQMKTSFSTKEEFWRCYDMFYTNHKSNDQKIVVNREKKIRFKENSPQ
ncbi:unnamed protein product [Oppiella nova]|uniref:Uncharacterized protein n=1 Tax=Oppiella nova TaxID=334625 RepID=A0A7R9QTU6_9ACAR|nr:unnamed protein product [Oppiella nova]CAG2174177.1 unnamed protein product [Oppiella nova]